MTITVRYFARLAEEAKLTTEVFETKATTVEGLWNEVCSRHGFTLSAQHIKAAQGDEFCPWKAKLLPGSQVVFMPPVAGG